ncbi:MAM domain-containing protein [Aphelenchoides besseyi]|nr:MAM domain-containing protein [Aphelenchoides besseyi]KAI6200348.1 MAM domain-containing protein [Aphelenchoides besseyi]
MLLRSGDLRIFLLLFGIVQITVACAQQYKRELRYLDYYLGIQPANEDGAFLVDASAYNSYVHDALSLNCNLKSPCLWSNAPSDDLLDTSDFYLFNKTDGKTFPIQIRPGEASPAPGTLFLLAGNTTKQTQSSVLLSAPIACQNSAGILTFQYWLYNTARVEVVLLQVNEYHNRLQVISRPNIDCHFLKSHGLCRVEIDRMSEPFRIGIRIFSLRDPSVGAFGMINDIHYKAELCGVQDSPELFGDVLLDKPLSRQSINTAAQLNCVERIESCLWSTAMSLNQKPRPSMLMNTDTWRVGDNIRRWDELVGLPTRPNGQFLYQYLDPMTQLPVSRLRSVFIPCTQTSSSLTFRYWMTAGIQAQVCSFGTDNVPYSCVYLDVAEAPGPVTIDIDAPDGNPFAVQLISRKQIICLQFWFEVIHFDKAGILAIDDIEFNGILCTETLSTTTLSPLARAANFELQPFPNVVSAFTDSLNCDFELDLCSHWNGDKSNAAIALFSKDGESAELVSQLVSCAHGGRFMANFMASEQATLSICANERCVHQRTAAGELAVNLTSIKPFRIRVLAESHGESFVIVKKLTTSDDGFCSLETPTQLACKLIQCNFMEGQLCSYQNLRLQPTDAQIEINSRGLVAELNSQNRRVILRSANFEISSAAELRFEAQLTAFGARLYVCPDEEDAVDLSSCELVLGPKSTGRMEKIIVSLDADIQKYLFVAVHDKFEQFGEAQLTISRVELTNADGSFIC